MKSCTLCKLEKELTEFHNDKKRGDGKYPQCKECYNKNKAIHREKNLDHARKIARENARKYAEKRHIYQKKKYQENLEASRQRGRDKYHKNRDRYREKQNALHKTPMYREEARIRCQKWRKEKKEEYNAYQRYYRKKESQKIRAIQKVNDALRYGNLVRPSKCSRCESTERIQAHHHDYSKPLDVIWLCFKCHCHEHNKLLDVP